MKKQPPIDE
ncbi:Protein of unknown function [Bacillus cereus]|nr:Protein of unknown function [Bacillus cereus]